MKGGMDIDDRWREGGKEGENGSIHLSLLLFPSLPSFSPLLTHTHPHTKQCHMYQISINHDELFFSVSSKDLQRISCVEAKQVRMYTSPWQKKKCTDVDRIHPPLNGIILFWSK